MKKKHCLHIGWLFSLWLIAITSCSQEDLLQEGASVSGNDKNTRADEVKTDSITSDTEGSLCALGSEGRTLYAGVEKLILKGKFNGEDIQYIRDNLDVKILDMADVELPVSEIPSGWFNKSESYWWDLNDGGFTQIILPKKGVTTIGPYAFYCCSSLTSITIPEGVTTIGEYAFESCSSLTSIMIPEEVTTIGSFVFYGCTSLTSITIPKGVTSIGNCAFSDCSSLTSITIPEGVTSIGNWAFSDCSSLTSITIPEGVTSIGNDAFYRCSSLTSINLPEGVTTIGEYAFFCCSSLTSITIPEGVTTIEEGTFGWCSSLTSITIPEGVTSIGARAFQDCSSLTSITIPEGVTTIEEGTFRWCSSLTSITIPEGVMSIGNSAFVYCRSLTSINIPDGMTSIGKYAFFCCSSLTSITIPEGVTSIGNDAFCGCRNVISHSSADIGDCGSNNYGWLLIESKDGSIPLYGANWINVAIDGEVEEAILPYQNTYRFDIPKEVKHLKKISYTMKFNLIYNQEISTNWYTISLPFKPTSIISKSKGLLAPFDSNVEGAKPFWLRELTEDGFKDVTSIEPNHSYIIAMPNSWQYADDYNITGEVTFSAEDVEWGEGANDTPVPTYGTDYAMFPTWEPLEPSQDIYVLHDGRFVNNISKVYPFEAYIQSTSMRSVISLKMKRTTSRGSNTRSTTGKPQKEDI